jgi:hypothetical protein
MIPIRSEQGILKFYSCFYFQVFSEFIILFVASAALYLEYRRSAAKEEAKQAALEQVC